MPLDLRLEYQGGGRFQTYSRLDWELAEGKLKPQDRVRAKVSKRRSVRQNDYFHAICELAFENQRAGPPMPTWRHLKSWLLIQAGHCDVKDFAPDAMTPAVAAVLRQVFDTVDFSTDGRRIYMKVARSVSFAKTDAEEMGAVVDKVLHLICTEIVPGTTPDQLMDMAKQRAA